MKKCVVIVCGVTLLTLSVMSAPARSVALSDEVLRAKIESGELDAEVERMRTLRAQGWDQPVERLPRDGLALGEKSVTTENILVILVDFNDRRYDYGSVAATPSDFDSLLFSDGLNPTGSMREYYIENSYGNYSIDGTVVGWYTTPHSYADFGYITGTIPVSQLVRGAINQADAEIDFTQFDNDGDNTVEGIIVIHAGTGREESGKDDEIHSHMATLNPPEVVDGVAVISYTMQPEESALTGTMSAIGVFCHEWGHILGLPDLYDIDYTSKGVARWSVMGSGNYNGLSKKPAHFDAWSKHQLGWLTLQNVTGNIDAAEIPAVEHNPVAYRLNKNGILGNEYWIVENRDQTGFDSDLPGYGLMVYHIDQDKYVTGNTDDWHPFMFVEQADGKFDLQYNRNDGDAGDTWPNGVLAREFHDKTVPDSKYYGSSSSQVALWNISDPDSVMTADIEVSFTRPWLEKETVTFWDAPFGDGDGTLEAGEKIQVVLLLRNDWGEATGVSATMTTDDPALGIVNGTRPFPDLATGATGSNSGSPFEFQIPGEFVSRIDSFFFQVTANGGSYETSMSTETNVGTPQILIVDDDGGDPDHVEDFVGWPLYVKRTPARYWDNVLSGTPPASTLSEYHAVIWLTGDNRPDLLTAGEISAITGYLDNGGNLFLTGQALAGQLAVQDPDFLANYLRTQHLSTVTGSSVPIPVLLGVGGPISTDTSQIVIIDGDGAANQTVQDHIVAVNDGVDEWNLAGTTDYAAVLYDGDYKLVFFTFGFESIRSDRPQWESRDTIMSRIIDFFGQIPTDIADEDGMAINLPRRFILDQNSPNPFNPSTRISYVVTGTDGGRADRTRLAVFNILGQHVVTLVDREEGPGQYVVTWDGRDRAGRPVASGLYFYRLTRADQSETKKMMLLK